MQQPIQRARVQCPRCTKYFARKADGNPWSHKCTFPAQVPVQPVQLQPLSEKNEKYIGTILDALFFEKEKITHCFKEQESLDSIKQDLNDGLYLELCNNLLKEVKHRGERISNYEKLLQDILQLLVN